MADGIDVLWERYGGLTLADIPEEARTAACLCILDWFGCTLAGSREQLAEILRAEFAGDTGVATILGTNDRASAKTAALVNGATGHALDFDDTNYIGGLHATASTMPAALAMAEATGATGADLLTAYIVGIEICCRLRVVLGEDHYRRGWHITSTLGIFGATAAAGWLLDLDAEQFRCAIGLAASQASGIHANFGTMTKPFHAGHASERGLVSASLAKRGYTANGTGFERYAEQTDGKVNWGVLDDLKDTWVVIDTLFKKFASCAGTQATIEATTRLLEGGLTVDDIVHAEVRVPPNVIKVCSVMSPTTGLQAKFSLPGVVALTMFGDEMASPGTFNDGRIRSRDVADLVSRVEVVGDPEVTANSAEVLVQTLEGSRLGEFRFDRSALSPPDLSAQLERKFMSLAPPVIGANASALKERVLNLATTPLASSLTELTLPG